MFVSIDMDNLVFLHKHHDHETVSALSWLECGQTISIRVEAVDPYRFLRGVSELDVRMLYKNTTGAVLVSADVDALRYQLSDAASLMAPTRALQHEVLAQVAAVEERLYQGERFKYALGAKVPAQPGELFPLKARPLTPKELGEAQARSANPVATYPPNLHGAKPWDPEPAQAAPSAPAAPTVAPAQAERVTTIKTRPASVRPAMYAVVNAIWEREGKPLDSEALTRIKNEAAEALKEQGFNPTTVRIKMTEWGRERLAQ